MIDTYLTNLSIWTPSLKVTPITTISELMIENISFLLRIRIKTPQPLFFLYGKRETFHSLKDQTNFFIVFLKDLCKDNTRENNAKERNEVCQLLIMFWEAFDIYAYKFKTLILKKTHAMCSFVKMGNIKYSAFIRV